MNRFVIAEAGKCIGCRTCEIACTLAHQPADTPYGLSPVTFSPRLAIVRSGSVTAPVLCRQCDDAPCQHACPAGAIVQTGDSVQVIQSRCVGCKTCVVACPYGAMTVVNVPLETSTGFLHSRTTRSEAHKCDLCDGHAEGPACIRSCPTKALHLIDRDAMEAITRRKQQQAALSLASNMTL